MRNRASSGTQGPFPVTTEYEGRTYEGSYYVVGTGDRAFVTLWFEGESKSTQAGNTGAEGTAERLLGQLLAWRDFARSKSANS